MKRGDRNTVGRDETPHEPTLQNRRSAAIAFEHWQQQWPAEILIRGEAWLHLQRIEEALAKSSTDHRGNRSQES